MTDERPQVDLISSGEIRNDLIKFGGEDFLRKVAGVFETLGSAPAADPVIPITKAAVEAALSVTYDDKVVGSEETSALLPFSEALTVDGNRRFKLKDWARAKILDAAQSSKLLDLILSEHERSDRSALSSSSKVDFDTRASAWLRDCIRGVAVSVASLSRPDIEAAWQASEVLLTTNLANASPLRPADLKKLMDRADWLRPMEILIGASPGDGQDRFVGRKDELRTLRTFVDVLRSESIAEFSSRLLKRAGSFFAGDGAAAMMLVARGGLGKSALVAKFALDHALGSKVPLPFVYFDFDRASLQPKEPLNLLIEAARQLSFQYADGLAALEQLQEDARKYIAERDSSGAREDIAAKKRDDMTSERGFFERLRQQFDMASRWSDRILIVFDTLETVQGSPSAIEGIRKFLIALCKDEFPQLRVLIAGRAEAPQLRNIPNLETVKQPLTLGALPVAEAREMVDKLGTSLMRNEWGGKKWAAMLAGHVKDGPDRREPLTLRVAVEFIKSAGKDARDDIVREIGDMGEAAKGDFVGRLYVRRILDHVPGADLRKVAFPGLVARQMTKDVLETVICPIVQVDPRRADDMFERLGREVWIVEKDGDILVHRPELRARSLPLMRRHDAEQFKKVASALRAYYRASGDMVEESYYRLLLGEHPDFLLDLPDECLDALKNASDDFSRAWTAEEMPYAEISRTYLRSRGGPLMAANAFEILPARLAIGHLTRAGAALMSLDDERCSAIIESVVKNLLHPSGARSPAEDIVRQTLLIKAGHWDAFDLDNVRTPDQFREAAALALYLGRSDRSQAERPAPLTNGDRRVHAERLLAHFPPETGSLSWKIRALMLPWLQRDERDLFGRVDQELARSLPSVIDGKPSDLSALCAVLVAGEVSHSWALRLWARSQIEPRDDTFACISSKQVNYLFEFGDASGFVHSMTDRTRQQLHDISQSPHRFMRPFVVRTDVMYGLASWLLENKDIRPEAAAILRDLFGVRHLDWVLPIGYRIGASLSLMHERAINDYLIELEPRPASSMFGSRPAVPAIGDGIWLARQAEKGGDLLGLLSYVRQFDRSEETQALHDRLLAWETPRAKLA